MEQYIINGGCELHGSVPISGAKNAALGIFPAVFLCQDTCRIENLPQISDVHNMLDILSSMGAHIRYLNKNAVEINTAHAQNLPTPYEMVRRLRASYYLIGALLGRFGKAEVALPGGCDFGFRPIDQHIKGFEALGATVQITEGGIVQAEAKEGLVGDSVYLDVVSVGATMNIMLAAVLAKGQTVIENAAREPHIVDLANFLNTMGADITGAGTDVIKIRGVERLRGCTYSIIPDQIEAGTYLALATATGEEVTVTGVIPKHLESITAKLSEMGAEVIEEDDSVTVRRSKNERLHRINVKTQPYPGFPTDAQPPLMAACLRAKGTTVFTENIFTNRYRHAEEFRRLGAAVSIEGRVAYVTGVERLTGAPLTASDLRGGAAMLVAGLCAEGATELLDDGYIDRGYDRFDACLSALGADVRCAAPR